MKFFLNHRLWISRIAGIVFLASLLGGAMSCRTANLKETAPDQGPAEVVRMYLESVRADNPTAADGYWASPPASGGDSLKPCDLQIKRFLAENTTWRIIDTSFEKGGAARVKVEFREPEAKEFLSDIVRRNIVNASRVKGPASLEDKLCDVVAEEISRVRTSGAPSLPLKTSDRWFHLKKIDGRWLIIARTETPE